MANYGNSFGIKENDPVKLNRINVWDRVEDFYPAGAVLKVSTTYRAGMVIPAGTPISVSEIGGEATLGGSSPIGLTMQDVVMGTQCCTLTIVTRGTLLESRANVTYTEAQKIALKGQIMFIKEA